MNVEIDSPRSASSAEATRKWPVALDRRLLGRLYVVGLIALYAPILVGATQEWVTNEYQTHGIPVFLVSVYLLWRIRRTAPRPTASPSAWGLVPLLIGLGIRVGTQLLRVEKLSIDIWSVVLVLMGSILILDGREMWRACRFPVLFLLAAGGVPEKLVILVGARLQLMSSTGAAVLTKAVGVPVLQAGNMISVPGCRLEVADACSGIKKLMAMCAFAVLYGYLFDLSLGRRLLLFASAIPIAIFANTIRVAALIVVSNAGGHPALAIAHDPAEIGALVVAYFLFVAVGKQLGCKNLRPSL